MNCKEYIILYKPAFPQFTSTELASHCSWHASHLYAQLSLVDHPDSESYIALAHPISGSSKQWTNTALTIATKAFSLGMVRIFNHMDPYSLSSNTGGFSQACSSDKDSPESCRLAGHSSVDHTSCTALVGRAIAAEICKASLPWNTGFRCEKVKTLKKKALTF